MKGYTRLGSVRIFGAPVHVHWTAFVVMGGLLAFSIKAPISAIAALAAYFGLILLHETGHAYFATRLGCHPRNIYLGVIHGLCEYDGPDNARDESIVAWGGVAAQFVVAVPLVALAQTTELASLPIAGPIVGFLGYISLIVACINLAPAKGLDGSKAWRLIPLLVRQYRGQTMAKKAAKNLLRRVK